MKNHINKNDERSKEYLTIIAGILIVGIFLNEYILPKLPKLSLLIFFWTKYYFGNPYNILFDTYN